MNFIDSLKFLIEETGQVSDTFQKTTMFYIHYIINNGVLAKTAANTKKTNCYLTVPKYDSNGNRILDVNYGSIQNPRKLKLLSLMKNQTYKVFYKTESTEHVLVSHEPIGKEITNISEIVFDETQSVYCIKTEKLNPNYFFLLDLEFLTNLMPLLAEDWKTQIYLTLVTQLDYFSFYITFEEFSAKVDLSNTSLNRNEYLSNLLNSQTPEIKTNVEISEDLSDANVFFENLKAVYVAIFKFQLNNYF